MRKCLILFLALLMLALPVLAEEGAALSLAAPDSTVRPGKAVTLSFTAPAAGSARLVVVDDAGTEVSVVMEDFAAAEGFNSLWWNGTYQGVPAPEGTYTLQLTLNGETDAVPVQIGSYAPYLTSIAASSAVVTPDSPVTVDYYASVDGSLTLGVWVDGAWRSLSTTSVTAGPGSVTFDGGDLYDGEAALTLTLSDTSGYPSNEEHVNLTLSGFGEETTAEPTVEPTDEPAADEALPEDEDASVEDEDAFMEDEDASMEDEDAFMEDEDASVENEDESAEDEGMEVEEVPDPLSFTPSYGSPYTDETMNYWTLPMDITDEAAVWEMLMQPMTIIDGNEKSQTSLYAEPDENSKRVAVVTKATQGVHVLETLDNGWSLVECYSSSFHDSKVKAWNMLTQGYIKTEMLKTVTPQDEYAIVVDKLTQRLYLFKEGKLFSTLLISTGVANERQPYNETRSGEFFIALPAMGGFRSDNMYCPRAMRFNDGDAIHEVPYIQRSEGSSKIYSATEPYLGQKASHGCIRVQRKKTPEGVNMQWLWDNRKKYTKMVIWEDWQGRQLTVPDDDLVLYYNPKGGSYYHSQEKCYSAKDSITFATFTYAELDNEDYAELKFCPYCAPALRVAEIEAINEKYAWGGDHDPVMTEARQKYLNGEYD